MKPYTALIFIHIYTDNIYTDNLMKYHFSTISPGCILLGRDPWLKGSIWFHDL